MNILISVRRFLIAIFAVCLIINMGFNFSSWISGQAMKPGKDEKGALVICSSSRKELESLRKEHLDPVKIKAFIQEDDSGSPDSYSVYAEMTPKSLKYASSYLNSNKIPYKKISSQGKKIFVRLGNSEPVRKDADILAERINSDTGIRTFIKANRAEASFCLIVENIDYGRAEGIIASFDKNINAKWVKSKKRR